MAGSTRDRPRAFASKTQPAVDWSAVNGGTVAPRQPLGRWPACRSGPSVVTEGRPDARARRRLETRACGSPVLTWPMAHARVAADVRPGRSQLCVLQPAFMLNPCTAARRARMSVGEVYVHGATHRVPRATLYTFVLRARAVVGLSLSSDRLSWRIKSVPQYVRSYPRGCHVEMPLRSPECGEIGAAHGRRGRAARARGGESALRTPRPPARRRARRRVECAAVTCMCVLQRAPPDTPFGRAHDMSETTRSEDRAHDTVVPTRSRQEPQHVSTTPRVRHARSHHPHAASKCPAGRQRYARGPYDFAPIGARVISNEARREGKQSTPTRVVARAPGPVAADESAHWYPRRPGRARSEAAVRAASSQRISSATRALCNMRRQKLAGKRSRARGVATCSAARRGTRRMMADEQVHTSAEVSGTMGSGRG